MIICVCATRNMYLQLQTVIHMILDTQPSVKRIYAFVEDDFNIPKDSIVQTINVGSFSPAKDNKLNGRSKWTYMTLIRCYFTQLIPQEEKVIYLDLDIILHGQLDELWNMDMTDYAIAGVIDSGVRRFRLPYLPSYEKYVNAGVLVMNLKFIKDHKLDGAIDGFLHRQECTFKDQDAVNTIFFPHIKLLDPQWNSNALNVISEHPIISHEIPVKPWEPNSQYYQYWQSYYAKTIIHLTYCKHKVALIGDELTSMATFFDEDKWEVSLYSNTDMTWCQKKWNLIIAFPSHNYLTIPEKRLFKKTKNSEFKQKRFEEIEQFMLIANANCEYIVLLNPTGIMSSIWRDADQTISPYQFGDLSKKTIDVWLKGLPPLVKTNEIKVDKQFTEPDNFILPGLMQTMAQQWGKLNNN